MTDIVCAGPYCEETFNPVVWNQKYHDPQCKRDAENVSKRRTYTEDVAKAVAPAYLDLEEGEVVEFLRKETSRLGRAVDKYKATKSELVDATYKAAYDAFSGISMPKIPSPTKDTRKAEEEVAVAVLADWQLGKVTPTYNTDICRKRISLYTDKILRITDIQRADHPVRKLHVWLLGDIVEGEDIFATQAHLIDSSLYRQVGVDGPEIIRDFLLQMLKEFEEVKVVGVIGNHGRLSSRLKSINPETNMDRLLYKITELMFGYEDRISFDIPDGHGESNFYAVDTIGNYSTLLLHGDQFPAPSTTHTYYKKVMGWKDGAIPQQFDDVFMGHYHQNAKMTLGSSILRVSGSPESYNTFAQETLGVMGRPSQHLQFVHPIHGVTSEHTIWLDDVT